MAVGDNIAGADHGSTDGLDILNHPWKLWNQDMTKTCMYLLCVFDLTNCTWLSGGLHVIFGYHYTANNRQFGAQVIIDWSENNYIKFRRVVSGEWKQIVTITGK